MTVDTLEQHGIGSLRRHLVAGDERGLLAAYEFGRAALAANLGVLEMTQLLWRIVGGLSAAEHHEASGPRIEAFMLESLCPFEMAHRGAREANEALRRIDERREEHVRQIARDLHDHAGQLLASVRLSLDALQPHLAVEGEKPFATALTALDGVFDEVRRLAHELRPAILDDLGLVPALQFLADDVTRRSGVAVTVTGSTGGRLPRGLETVVFRTTQEALTNVARHARASHAVIDVQRDLSEIRWEVRDDGRGFDPAGLGDREHSAGTGLYGIRERVAPLGGIVEIRSRPGEGTALVVRVPLEVAHANAPSAG